MPDVEIAGGNTPITATLVADGETPVFTILPKDDNGVVCGGLVSGAAPEFVFSYSGDVEDLRIFFEGSADASLVVVGEEIVLCSDDSEGARTATRSSTSTIRADSTVFGSDASIPMNRSPAR